MWRSSWTRRICARATRRRSPTSPSRPRRPGWHRGCRPPACAPSTTSSTSPTTCCSSSASRCTRSISTSSRASEIRIRRAAPGERITTLDGVDRALDTEMLVIADAEKAQAVAGVMGGGRSEVSDATKTIVLESAFFDPKSVRRTSKKLGLKTEASARFERGADVNAARQGHRARDHAPRGDRRGTRARRRHRRISRAGAPRKIELRQARIQRMLGLDDPGCRRRAHPQGSGLPDRAGATPDGSRVRRRSASTCCAKST